MSDFENDQFLANAYEFICSHELSVIIQSNYITGPPNNKGYMWYDWKSDDELGEVYKAAYAVMDQFVLNSGYDSGASFACAHRAIQNMICERVPHVVQVG